MAKDGHRMAKDGDQMEKDGHQMENDGDRMAKDGHQIGKDGHQTQKDGDHKAKDDHQTEKDEFTPVSTFILWFLGEMWGKFCSIAPLINKQGNLSFGIINHPHLFPFPLSISFFALDYF